MKKQNKPTTKAAPESGDFVVVLYDASVSGDERSPAVRHLAALVVLNARAGARPLSFLPGASLIEKSLWEEYQDHAGVKAMLSDGRLVMESNGSEHKTVGGRNAQAIKAMIEASTDPSAVRWILSVEEAGRARGLVIKACADRLARLPNPITIDSSPLPGRRTAASATAQKKTSPAKE